MRFDLGQAIFVGARLVVIADGKKVYGGGKDLVPGKELAAFLPRLR